MRFLPQRGERHADQGRPQESGAFYGPVFGPVLQIKAQTAGLPAAARKSENGAQMAAPQRKFADMKILRMNWVRGPGVWTYRSIIEAVLDIGELEDFPSNTIPGYYERLTAWLPGLVEHKCGVGERGGFLQRLREGTWPGHVMEHVALELQMQAGMNTAFGKTRMTGEHAVYKVVIRAFDEAVGRLALESARDLVMAAINGTPYDVPAAIARLKALGEQRCFSAGTACIVDAALARGIPEREQSGAARARRGAAPHLGHHHGPHQRHCSGHLARQRPAARPAQRRGHSRARRPRGQQRRRRLGSRRRHRPARHRQIRHWRTRARTGAEPLHARAGHGRLAGRRRAGR